MGRTSWIAVTVLGTAIIATSMCYAQQVSLPDASLQEAMRKSLPRDALASGKADLAQLEHLYVTTGRVSNLSGLADARNLRSLRLYNSAIADLSALASVSGLEELVISSGQVQDIGLLGRMPEMKYLVLSQNRIADLSALARCRKLRWLDLRDNQVEDIAPLADLRNLAHVDLRDNPLNQDAIDIYIPKIQSNNPHAQVLYGHYQRPAGSAERLATAKATIADLSLIREFEHPDGLIRPLLPESSQLLEALKTLQEAGDEAYMADIAVVMLKYNDLIMRRFPPGGSLNADRIPLMKLFRDASGGQLPEDLPPSWLAKWIVTNRDRLGPSAALDQQIRKYHELQTFLKKKYEIPGVKPTWEERPEAPATRPSS